MWYRLKQEYCNSFLLRVASVTFLKKFSWLGPRNWRKIRTNKTCMNCEVHLIKTQKHHDNFEPWRDHCHRWRENSSSSGLAFIHKHHQGLVFLFPIFKSVSRFPLFRSFVLSASHPFGKFFSSIKVIFFPETFLVFSWMIINFVFFSTVYRHNAGKEDLQDSFLLSLVPNCNLGYFSHHLWTSLCLSQQLFPPKGVVPSTLYINIMWWSCWFHMAMDHC